MSNITIRTVCDAGKYIATHNWLLIAVLQGVISDVEYLMHLMSLMKIEMKLIKVNEHHYIKETGIKSVSRDGNRTWASAPWVITLEDGDSFHCDEEGRDVILNKLGVIVDEPFQTEEEREKEVEEWRDKIKVRVEDESGRTVEETSSEVKTPFWQKIFK